MRKIEKVMLLDTRELIVREGVEFEEYEHYERQPLFEVWGYEMVRLGRLFGLDIHQRTVVDRHVADGNLTAGDVTLHVYPGEFDRWRPVAIEGEVANGILNLVLDWGEDCLERIAYNGKFMVWWAEPDEASTHQESEAVALEKLAPSHQGAGL